MLYKPGYSLYNKKQTQQLIPVFYFCILQQAAGLTYAKFAWPPPTGLHRRETFMLDELDRRIIGILRKNARVPVKEIAQQVSLTSPAVSSRIRRLEQDGVIAGYTAILHDPDSSSWINALISIAIQPASRDEFLQDLNGLASVQQCYHVTGSYSYIVRVCCRDMDELERLITRFQRLGQTSTQIVLSTPLDRTQDTL